MSKRARRKTLPTLTLGDPRPPLSPGYVGGYPGDPLAAMAAPSVAPHTEGAEISMPMDTAMAVEDHFGPHTAQSLTTEQLADWLDEQGLPYRWTMPR